MGWTVGDPVFAVSAALPVEKSYSTWAVLAVVYTNNTFKNFFTSVNNVRYCVIVKRHNKVTAASRYA